MQAAAKGRLCSAGSSMNNNTSAFLIGRNRASGRVNSHRTAGRAMPMDARAETTRGRLCRNRRPARGGMGIIVALAPGNTLAIDNAHGDPWLNRRRRLTL